MQSSIVVSVGSIGALVTFLLLQLSCCCNGFVIAAAAAAASSSSSLSSSLLDNVPMGPPDAILGIAQAFRACTDERKVNVCVGAYRDENGKPWVLPSVRQAEQILLQQQQEGTNNKEYLPIEGDVDFIQKALTFAYGTNVDLSCLAGVQTLSGTGACRVGSTFLHEFTPPNTPIYIPTPTWGNHWKIVAKAGFTNDDDDSLARPYRYYSRESNGLDFDGMLEDLREAPPGSIILLHGCAHNPTGCDPTQEQWKEIYKVMQERQHIAFFDSAYQGFASGNAEMDAWALRYFVEQSTTTSSSLPLILLAQSFAKNFGLYGERCGTLSILCQSPDERERVMSQLRLIIRPMYSNPPKHGSSIVKTILGSDDLDTQYREECLSMAQRILAMRTRLVEALHEVGDKAEKDWSFLLDQIGMFAYTGMTPEQCDELTDKYAIYLTRDGRISVAGLNEGNVEYVAKAIHAVTNKE